MPRLRSTLRNALQVRLDDHTLGWLETAAERETLAPSVYVRRLLESHAVRDLQPTAEGPDDAAV